MLRAEPLKQVSAGREVTQLTLQTTPLKGGGQEELDLELEVPEAGASLQPSLEVVPSSSSPPSPEAEVGLCSCAVPHPGGLKPQDIAGVWGPALSLPSWDTQAEAATMPHFLDWFVPVYLVISVLILVGFGACIYYFEPGLQEAHKWRVQRPMVDRDLRKTLMVRDNLAFGGPEV